MKSDSSTKSKLKRLFERQFPKFSGTSAVSGEVDQSSVCLDKLVVGFIEESNEKPSVKCGRRRCNCFNGNCDDSSDDEAGDTMTMPQTNNADASELLKGLVPCASVEERNLLADASKIVESNKSRIGKGKENCVKFVYENLVNLGYDAAICKSKWDKTATIPAGEYEYIDVSINSDRFILDVDFKSEFEIARSTKNYRSILQSLPVLFVGKSDRIEKIVAIISDAAKQSLKKKGLSFPPWRKVDYMKSKWLAPYERLTAVKSDGNVNSAPVVISTVNFNGEFQMRGVESSPDKISVLVSPWTPPAVKPKSVTAGTKVVTGLSLALTEKSTALAKF